MIKILWADDDINAIAQYRQYLAPMKDEIDINIVSNGYDAIKKLLNEQFDLVITDLKMEPGWGGLWLLDQIKAKQLKIRVIVLSGEGGTMQMVEAINRGAYKYIVKEDVESKLFDFVYSAIQSTGNEEHEESNLITPDKPFSNRQAMIDVISNCNEYMLIIDKYFNEEGFDFINKGIKRKKYDLSEIKILMTTAIKTIDYNVFRESFKKLKEEFANNHIKIDLRIITKKDSQNLHDRFLISKSKGYLTASVDTIKRGQLSIIKELNSAELKTVQEYFDVYWEKSLDIIHKWNEIKENIPNLNIS